MIKCPACGAEMKFDPKLQKVKCEYCDSVFDAKELRKEAKRAKEYENVAGIEGKSYTCSSCGATLLTFDETAITFCSYCGSQAMLESKMMKINNPDYVIPFKKTKEECIDNYKKLLRKSLFAPSYMKSDITISKFRGIYMPYCIYKLTHNGKCTNVGSKRSGRVGDYVIYTDYKIDAEVDGCYDGISFDLLSKFYDTYSQAIPFDFSEAEKFNKNYLIGYYADTKDVDSEVYRNIAKNIADGDSTRFLRKRKEFRKYGCNNPTVPFDVSETKIGMFPVYFLAVRDKSNKYVNYAIVNGQTGKVVADLPIDFKKYLLGSLLLAVLFFFLINNLFTIKPGGVIFFSIVASIVSIIITAVNLKKLQVHDTHMEDKGFISIKENRGVLKNKMSFGEKFLKYYFRQILAIIISLIPIFMHLVDDLYYYGASIISILLIITTFSSLVKAHNLLVSRKIVQLEKRGGDENE